MKLRSRTISALGMVVALASAGGLVAMSAPPDARAAGETDSAVTLKWAGGNGDLQQYQPDRSRMVDDADGSGHWDDFKDLEVTVSQTEDLIDQVVTVTASGMAPTARGGTGNSNFLQLMQCWGDPLSEDFNKSCQYGGYSNIEVGGTGGSHPVIDATHRGYYPEHQVKFQAVTGQENETVEIPTGPDTSYTSRGLGAFFEASASNEQPFVPVAGDGTARYNMVMQSGAAQPYLGCGNPETAGERCWLVVVPRGTRSGTPADGSDTGRPADGTLCGRPGMGPSNVFGSATTWQNGSPLSANCTFWDNRMVFPLDFRNPFRSCPAGAAERRVAGSELIADAMSSWQTALCAGEDGATFSLNTNSGTLTRTQLLTGAVDFAAVGLPLTPDTIGTASPEQLAAADLGYAPLANTALTIGFVAQDEQGKAYTNLRLTPRLVAKLLTQSYKWHVPNVLFGAGEPVGESYDVLGKLAVVDDEEWAALGNPTDFGAWAKVTWIVSGPRGDDAIRLLWQYVQADADARAFLRGEPDPWGNTVNPYYLPARHPRAAGGGYDVDLSEEPLDMFPKADQTLFPDKATATDEYKDEQIDSDSYSPYAEDLEDNAVRVAKADSRRVESWDKYYYIGVGIPPGRWARDAPPSPDRPRLMMGPVMTTSAELYGLSTASLALPLDETTAAENVADARQFVEADEESMSRAVAAVPVDETGVGVVDVTDLPDGAYPLTTTVHAAVDLREGRLDPQARTEYAHLLTYAATDGNVITGDRGGLPEGYVPLTAEQQAAALDLADRLLAPPGADPGPERTGSDGDGDGGSDSPGDSADQGGDGRPGDAGATVPVPVDEDESVADDPPSDPGADGGPGGPTTTQNEASATEDTAPLAASVALGGTLVAGLAGMIGAPFLMRRRELTG
ncbi:hypothetical protein [Myceligenerans pegani]|uniref:PBP domain-containing protein n=1 Tax=Myceligenerans pegani TaxID=2776917 RepID=A0ABR9N1W4_9MICO|nr:hypothetical protein [Myceligenerans sp. TRM 65318]MBE1877648.1 hypothetical protein [Myceligenerans sp. TRM 65318]MBE3019919.1 hypothetical protein [Myceligenerans sp. TRM 65318]